MHSQLVRQIRQNPTYEILLQKFIELFFSMGRPNNLGTTTEKKAYRTKLESVCVCLQLNPEICTHLRDTDLCIKSFTSATIKSVLTSQDIGLNVNIN